MRVKIKRIDKKAVRLIFTKDENTIPTPVKIEDGVHAHHQPGLIEQANLYIMQRAVEWKARHIIIELEDDRDITKGMITKAKGVFPYRGTIEIINIKEKEDEPV